MQGIGCFEKLMVLKLSTVSRIVSSVGVFTANSCHIASHEERRAYYFDLSWSIDFSFREARTLSSRCIKRSIWTMTSSLYLESASQLTLYFPGLHTLLTSSYIDGVR